MLVFDLQRAHMVGYLYWGSYTVNNGFFSGASERLMARQHNSNAGRQELLRL